MTRVYVGLGSNLGDRQIFLGRALGMMRKLDATRLLRWSSAYETEPVGNKDQPVFLNLVAELDTNQSPDDFLRSLKLIEQQIGRSTTERWGPREIDLDILYFGNVIMNEDGLKIPHPEVANRRFVLVPLKDLAPDLVDPLHQRSVQDLLRVCTDTCAVRTTSFSLQPAE
jgi:2-amino-4-hydroxy-6-hydroxymethyldihydropteridine diphosphokinase